MKLKNIIVSAITACVVILSGCDLNEQALITSASTAGQLSQLVWFSIDNPDPEVKAVLKDVVTKVTSSSVKVAEGETYLEAILPEVQEIALKQDKLNDYQKTLINAGSVIILNGIDTFIASNEKVKNNAELVSKVVASFGKGCLMVLNMPETAPEIQRARTVYASRSMTCRGGKFLTCECQIPNCKCSNDKCKCEK